VGTFTLLPQVLDVAGDTPVIAAGGVGHGRQLAGALAIGAQAVWLGTLWLATDEHALAPALVDQLLLARSEDTLLTRSHSGKPCRVLGSGWTDEWHAPGAPEPLPMPYQQVLTGPLVAAVEEHSVTSLLYTPAGQSVAWVQQRETVQAVIDRLVAQARLALDNLGRLIGAG
jgi:NAD(P)H-dependent flavin oxidoreductase YrpB (nitropropane dioxygenase family)